MKTKFYKIVRVSENGTSLLSSSMNYNIHKVTYKCGKWVSPGKCKNFVLIHNPFLFVFSTLKASRKFVSIIRKHNEIYCDAPKNTEYKIYACEMENSSYTKFKTNGERFSFDVDTTLETKLHKFAWVVDRVKLTEWIA